MKKVLLLGISFISFLSSYAQDTTSCNMSVADTVGYTVSKTSTYQAISMNEVNDGGAYGYAGYGQRFGAPDSVLISGFCFRGFVYSGATNAITCALHKADGAGMPGVQVASSVITMPQQLGYSGPMSSNTLEVCVDFGTPFYVEGDYILTVQNLTNSDMYMVRNIDGNGAGEDLGYLYYKGVSDPQYDGWYKTFPFGAGWNFDMIIEPIIHYDFGTQVIANDTLLCVGDTLDLQLSLTPGDSALFSKYYNPNYATYTGLFSSNIMNYGDGTSNTVSTSHVYNTGGTFAVSRDFNIVTPLWSQNSMIISCDGSVRVVDASVDLGADTSVCAGTLVSFDASLGMDSYLWQDMSTLSSFMVDTDTMNNGVYNYYVDVTKEFCASSDTVILTVGDLVISIGADTTLCLNQDLTISAGTYDSYMWNTGQTTQSIMVGPFTNPSVESYILSVTDGNCQGSDTLVLTVDNCLGVEENLLEVTLFPNPSNGNFTIDFSNISSPEGNLNIIDNTGRVVFNKKITNFKENINIENLTSGSYFVRISVNGSQILKKIQIIN